jgi:hypothetical protein
MARHIFVDNSNIYGGAQRAAATIEPAVHWLSIRVQLRNLFRLIEGDDVATRTLAGSVPPGNEALWQTARDLGYDTDLLQRVEQDDGRLGEQAVDEMLHLKMANAILDHEPPQTLVIASGDGLTSKWATSFPGQAERALKRGWNVEVWSWMGQLTGQYQRLCREYPGRVIVKVLDPYYRSLTFVKPGDYTTDGVTTTLAQRNSTPLDAAALPAADRAA